VVGIWYSLFHLGYIHLGYIHLGCIHLSLFSRCTSDRNIGFCSLAFGESYLRSVIRVVSERGVIWIWSRMVGRGIRHYLNCRCIAGELLRVRRGWEGWRRWIRGVGFRGRGCGGLIDWITFRYDFNVVYLLIIVIRIWF
jgi:hypothetical protein